MARKNVVAVTTNVTPEQMEVITGVSKKLDVGVAHLVRMALSQFVERNNGEWPTAEIKHGGIHKPTNSENIHN
jgi:hypothetical protein